MGNEHKKYFKTTPIEEIESETEPLQRKFTVKFFPFEKEKPGRKPRASFSKWRNGKYDSSIKLYHANKSGQDAHKRHIKHKNDTEVLGGLDK